MLGGAEAVVVQDSHYAWILDSQPAKAIELYHEFAPDVGDARGACHIVAGQGRETE